MAICIEISKSANTVSSENINPRFEHSSLKCVNALIYVWVSLSGSKKNANGTHIIIINELKTFAKNVLHNIKIISHRP